MSLGVIAESVTSSLASNFSADGITPRQICTFRSLRDHGSIKKDIIYLRLQYLIDCYIIEIILQFICISMKSLYKMDHVIPFI